MENIFKAKVNNYLPAKLEIKKFSGGETQVMFHNPSTSDEGNIVELFALIRDGDIIFDGFTIKIYDDYCE